MPAAAPMVDSEQLAARRPGVSVARALGSTTRAGIYEHLQQAGASLTVRDVAAAFDLHPNVARTHLELLADAGLVVVGRRKHPGGGRPAKVYLARDEATAELVPVTAGFRGAGAFAAPLLVKLLVGLSDLPPLAGAARGEHPSRRADAAGAGRASELAAAEGRRLVSALPSRDGGQRRGLEAAAETAVRALRASAPEARVTKAGSDWVELAGVRGMFALLDAVRPELAEAFERGLLIGAFAAAGAAVTLAGSEAGGVGVGSGRSGTAAGGSVWRIRAAAPVSGRAVVAAAATVDTRGLQREAGVVAALRTVVGLRAGEVLEVLAEGPGSPAAFARWADRAGHQLLGVERATDPAGRPAIRLLIRKGQT